MPHVRGAGHDGLPIVPGGHRHRDNGDSSPVDDHVDDGGGWWHDDEHNLVDDYHGGAVNDDYHVVHDDDHRAPHDHHHGGDVPTRAQPATVPDPGDAPPLRCATAPAAERRVELLEKGATLNRAAPFYYFLELVLKLLKKRQGFKDGL